jgi:hypothetical protein
MAHFERPSSSVTVPVGVEYVDQPGAAGQLARIRIPEDTRAPVVVWGATGFRPAGRRTLAGPCPAPGPLPLCRFGQNSSRRVPSSWDEHRRTRPRRAAYLAHARYSLDGSEPSVDVTQRVPPSHVSPTGQRSAEGSWARATEVAQHRQHRKAATMDVTAVKRHRAAPH